MRRISILDLELGMLGMMNVRFRSAPAVAAVATAVFMVCVLPTPASAAPPPLTPGGPQPNWAYAGVRTIAFSGHALLYAYQGTATYGYSVILRQTNTSDSTFELFANRTMGALLSLEFCLPSCSNPTSTATVDYHAWEATDEWANFTMLGSVNESGTLAGAVALENSHVTVAGNVTDVANAPDRSWYLSGNVSASASVTFSTPLGLLPFNLTPGTSWTDTAPFTANGTYSVGLFYHHVAASGKITEIPPTTVSGSVNATGSVTVIGSVGATPVQFGGVSFQNVSLAVEGPFAVREGFILVPEVVDLFGTGSSTIDANESGFASVDMTSVYAQPMVGGHLGISGSEYLYQASAINPSSVTDALPTSSGVDEIASGASQVSSTPVQGVPVPVGQAQSSQTCLIAGKSCPAAPGGGRMLGGAVAIGVLALVIGAVAAVVVVAERRRMPPPAYPNAQLYPPGAPGGAAAPAARPRPPPPPSEDDPLAHLW